MKHGGSSLGELLGRAESLPGMLSVVVAGAIIVFQVVSTFSDALLRYLLGSPIPGVVEINTLSMPTLTFISLAGVQQMRGHINVNLAVHRLNHRAQVVLETALYVVGICFMSLMGYMSLGNAINAINIDEYMWGTARIPMWWARVSVPVGCWLLSLQYLADIRKNCDKLRQS